MQGAMLFLSIRLAVLISPLAFAAKFHGSSVSFLGSPSHPELKLAAVSKPELKLAVVGKHAQTIGEMESVFVRSQEVHQHSIDTISKELTLPKAIQVVQNSSLVNSTSLKQISQITNFLDSSKQFRKVNTSGFGGIEGARKLLNEMIHESMLKYDEEIAKCTDFYAKQCALMEVARGQISAANLMAASSRGLILDAQGNIGMCNKAIPTTKQELKDHNRKCKSELAKMNKNLKALMGDIAVMTMILKMSDCDAKKLLQTDDLAMLLCEDECSKKNFLTFNHSDIQQEMNELSTPTAKDRVADAFGDFFADGDSVDPAALTQMAGFDTNSTSFAEVTEDGPPAKCKAILYEHGDYKGWAVEFGNGDYPHKAMVKKGVKNDAVSAIKVFGLGCKAIVYEHGDFTGWKAEFTTGEYPHDQFVGHGAKNDAVSAIRVMPIPTKPRAKIPKKAPPVPRTKVPVNPCSASGSGVGGSKVTRAGTCTLGKSPKCYQLQAKFLAIQAEIADARDDLMEQISKQEDSCKETATSLEAAIENDNNLLSTSQTKLAAATEKEASAQEQSRQIGKENEQYNADLMKMMGKCNSNYIDYETELCALRKIRGDLFKKMSPGHKGFFGDCEVSKWSPEACNKKCAGGVQKLTRTVLTHPSGGSKCLPLAAKRKCNRGPCPISCKLETWGGWSKCSAKCGGGVTQRVRDIKVAPRYGGKPCSSSSETKACNVAACSKDCDLTKWTQWTGCSKDCDGGTMKRQRFVKEPAQGSGKCPGTWEPGRLQYKPCNEKSCKIRNPKEVLKCQRNLDIVLMLDGAPKSGLEAWNAEVKAANLFVDAFTGKGVASKPNFAVIHYSGPRTWSGVSQCTGKSTKKVDIEKTCKVKIASHFTQDIKKVKGTIGGLTFQPGAKLLSLGLMSAISELPLSRPTVPSIVVVFMDGQPLSFRKTMLASRQIRKKARLVYVVVTKFSPLKPIRSWASRRWQENIVTVKEPKELGNPETGTHLVANICPKAAPKVTFGKKVKSKTAGHSGLTL